jgi:outer membrane protein
MKTLKNYYLCTVLLVTIGLIVICIVYSINSTLIAYIRSSELIYKYTGMIEAHQLYEAKATSWKANVDTLQAKFQRDVDQYNREISKLNYKERQSREESLKKEQNNLVNYSKAIEQKAKEEEEKITQGVLNQVNSFIESYGKEHGYDIILGTTLSGNLLYGNKKLDITDKVLKAINENYQKGTQ